MVILYMLIIGLLVGALAKFLVPGDDPGGMLVTSLLGIAGALVAGYLGQVSGWYAYGEPVGFFAATLGAVLILVVFRLIRRGKA